jgi:hypothetical protein
MEGHSQHVSMLGGRGNAGLVRTYVDLLRSFLFYVRSIIVFQHVRSQGFWDPVYEHALLRLQNIRL